MRFLIAVGAALDFVCIGAGVLCVIVGIAAWTPHLIAMGILFIVFIHLTPLVPKE